MEERPDDRPRFVRMRPNGGLALDVADENCTRVDECRQSVFSVDNAVLFGEQHAGAVLGCADQFSEF